jgi:hypothetical protein
MGEDTVVKSVEARLLIRSYDWLKMCTLVGAVLFLQNH